MRPASLFVAVGLALGTAAQAGQPPFTAARANMPISHRDRVYAAEQFSNTVSVIDPVDNRLLGVIRLGEPQPTNFSPLYRGQLLVHGMGFAPDGKTIAVVSIGSNAVIFIDTATNAVKHTTYVGRSPHEAFYTQDGRELWVTVRGEDYVAVLDAATFAEIARIKTPNGPGMTIFSPDGRYAYVCSSFTPTLVIFDVKTRAEVGRVDQPSPFCPNLAATPDGKQVWYTLKDIGKTVVIDARPPFARLRVLDTGPITNHVNFADNARGGFAYVTVGGLNQVAVFRRSDFARVTTIAVGKLPHGVWPSGDGSRIYTSMENGDEMLAIDTLNNRIVARVPIGQGAQAMNYVPNAVPDGNGMTNLVPLGIAANAIHLELATLATGAVATSVSLFDQGAVQILQASVTGLQPGSPYVLGLSERPDGQGAIVPLATFITNPAGAAVVNASGPVRDLVRDATQPARRFLVIVSGTLSTLGPPAQTQTAIHKH